MDLVPLNCTPKTGPFYHNFFKCKFILQFPPIRSPGMACVGSPARLPQGWNQAVSWLCPFLELRVSHKLTQAAGRVQLLAVVGLRSQVPCWLSAEGCSRLFEASCAPCHKPLHLQSQQWRRSLMENPSKTPNLSNFSTSYLHTVIQRDLDLIKPTQITSLS